MLSTLCLLFVSEEEELYLLENVGCLFCDFAFLLFGGMISVGVFQLSKFVPFYR